MIAEAGPNCRGNLAAADLTGHGEAADAVQARLVKGGFTADQVLGDWFPNPPRGDPYGTCTATPPRSSAMNARDALAILRRPKLPTATRYPARCAVRLGCARRQPAGNRYRYPDRIRSRSSGYLFDYIEVKDYINSLFGSRVDADRSAALKSHLRGAAERDAIDTFDRARSALMTSCTTSALAELHPRSDVRKLP